MRFLSGIMDPPRLSFILARRRIVALECDYITGSTSMLKAIELVGFKSFADKTRFEFPPGITVIVGPNGSGKSNVVDAIKWVFGEQSAKSLRGKDMADVIFKGTHGASGRKPAGSASATIVLDNLNRRLPLDCDEVHITRRVYRSGEGEYLINGENCRLKDIRNLIRGTGVGVDAYSLIEQGKVERLLQASNKDRRAIFEEAAGISRFNAKKIEAQRRLVRADQSLLRLRDIVEEVGARYRTIKSQAAKAGRYREYTHRLQQLRTDVGLHDWREFSRQLTEGEREQIAFRSQIDSLRASADLGEKQLQDTELRWSEVSSQVTTWHNELATCRESIANAESRIALNEIRQSELTERIDVLRNGLARLEHQHNGFKSKIAACQMDVAAAETDFERSRLALSGLEESITTVESQAQQTHRQLQQNNNRRDEISAAIIDLGRRISGMSSQLSAATETQRHIETEIEQGVGAVTRYESDLDQCRLEQQRLRSSAESIDGNLAAARRSFEQQRHSLQALQTEIGQLSSDHAGLKHRAEIIDEVEQRLEGINQGARYILAQAQSDGAGLWSEVIGLVADLVQVNVEHAEIIDIALGDYAQYVVVQGDNLIRAIVDGRQRIAGRAGLIRRTVAVDTGKPAQSCRNCRSDRAC